MIGLANTRPAGAAGFGALDRGVDGEVAHDVPQAVLAIDHDGGRRIGNHPRPSVCVHQSSGEPLQIDGDAGDAVGIDAAQIRVHQPVRHDVRVLVGNAGGTEYVGGKRAQIVSAESPRGG